MKPDMFWVFVAGVPVVLVLLTLAPVEFWQFLNRFMPKRLCDWFESCHMRPRQIKLDGPFYAPAGDCPRCGKRVFRTNGGKWFEMYS